MRRLYAISLILLVGICGQVEAQSNNMGFTTTTNIDSPQRYGNGSLFYLAQGDNLMAQGEFEQAIIAYDNAVQHDPLLAEVYVKRALAKHRIGRVREAEADFAQANAFNPYAADLYSERGGAARLSVLAFEPYQWLTTISLEDRLNFYGQYLQQTKLPNEVNRTISLIRTGAYDQALEVLNIYTEQSDQHLAIAYDLIGLVHGQNDRLEEAYDAHLEAIEIDDEFAIAHYSLSWVEKMLGNYNDAIAHISRCIEIDASLYQAYFQRAMLYKLVGKYDLALEDYQLLSQKTTGAELDIRFHKAMTNKMAGNAAEALRDIDRLIRERRQEDALLYKLRGNIYMLLGKYQYAVNDYNRAIALDNDFAEAFFNRGMARLMLYNRPDACYDLEQGVELGYETGAKRFQLFCGF
ncbi:MAG: tetratricopeptide repeat protein [Bacteroidota bacterium]